MLRFDQGWTLLLFAGIAILVAHGALQWAAGERKDIIWRAFFAAYGGFLQQGSYSIKLSHTRRVRLIGGGAIADGVPVPPGNSGRVLMAFFLSYTLIMGTLTRASLVSFYWSKGKGIHYIEFTGFGVSMFKLFSLGFHISERNGDPGRTG